MTDRCDHCRFWDPVELPPVDPNDPATSPEGVWGMCCRNSPVPLEMLASGQRITLFAVWPLTEASKGCGDFQPQPLEQKETSCAQTH